MRFGLVVCDEHADGDIDHLVTDEGWEQIVNTFAAAGKAEPDRSTLEIHYHPIHDA